MNARSNERMQPQVGIENRQDVFYWQTDRAIEPRQAGDIWADRHRYFTDGELVDRANNALGADNPVISIVPMSEDAQTNLGNVNSVRVLTLQDGQEIVMRSHPKGIKNGYFHAEALASGFAKRIGVPSYDTLAVHDYEGGDDFAFHLLEKLPGHAMQKWLERNPQDEEKLLLACGKTMASIHKVEVDGFGPFDNDRARNGELVGLHDTFVGAVRAGLAFNLDVMVQEEILDDRQAQAVDRIFSLDNPLLNLDQAVLVHNDFADWNVLTDGNEITGVLDWDECVAGDQASDIACWSTFFDPERMDKFMEGYWSVADKPADFDQKFELLRLRYVLSKMTLRVRRYSWQPTEFMKGKIETGKIHLADSMKYFDL